MKFSFIRFFKAALASCNTTREFLDELRGGEIDVWTLVQGSVSTVLRNMLVDSGMPAEDKMDDVVMLAWLKAEARRSNGFISSTARIEYDAAANQCEPLGYLHISKQALELLPKYIPELAR